MIFDHIRNKVVSKNQHLLTHSLSEFGYGNNALPSSVTNAEQAIDWILTVLYPNTKPSVLTPADLPTGIDTPNIGDVTPSINDYRLVQNDGTGKTAGYLYVKYDLDPSPTWHKTHSFDWGMNNVLQGLVNATQPLYPKKDGSTDYDPITGLAITGVFAGQSIYGGEATNQNLTLNATNFDNTGYVQFNDNVRPTLNSTFSLGTNTERFLNFFTDSATIGTTTITAGTITDTSGTVDFGSDTIATLGLISGNTLSIGTSGVIGSVNISSTITTVGGTTDFASDNLTTLGSITAASINVNSATIADFTFTNGSLTSLSPTINFVSNNLLTTGNISGSDLASTTATIGSLSYSGTGITSASSIDLTSTGLNVNSPLTVTGLSSLDAVSIAATKAVTFSTGLFIDGNGIDNGGNNISFNGGLLPSVDTSYSLGSAPNRFLDLFLSGSIKGSVDSMLVSDLMYFNNAQFRDIAKTLPVLNGDILVYDNTASKWMPVASSSIIPHNRASISFAVDFTTLSTQSYNLSATFTDVSNVIWQMYDSAGNVVLVDLNATTTTLTVTRDPALVLAGTYKIIGMEI